MDLPAMRSGRVRTRGRALPCHERGASQAFSRDLTLDGSLQRVEVRLRDPFGRLHQPRLDDELFEIGYGDPIEAYQDRGVPIEVWSREIHVRIVGEQSLLHTQIRYARAEDRTIRGGVAEGCVVGLA